MDIFTAIRAGNREAVKALLDADPSLLATKNAAGDSLLLASIYSGQKPIADDLLSRGVSVNFFEAAALGSGDRVAALLESNPALLGDYSHDGFTALHLAVFFGHRDLVKHLLDLGADPRLAARNKTFASGVSPLQSAVTRGSVELAKLLLDRGADVNARDADDGSPLFTAAFNGNLALVELLLARGARADVRHKSGQTPLGIAREKNHAAVAQVLARQDAGA
jgi:ankyrin repeat protein